MFSHRLALLWLIAHAVLCSGQAHAAESASYILNGSVSNPLGDSVRTSAAFQLIEESTPTFYLRDTGQGQIPSTSSAGKSVPEASGNPRPLLPQTGNGNATVKLSAAPAPTPAARGKVPRKKRLPAASNVTATKGSAREAARATVRSLRQQRGASPAKVQAAARPQLMPLGMSWQVSGPPEQMQAATQLQASLLDRFTHGTTGWSFLSLIIVTAAFLAGFAFRPLVEGSAEKGLAFATAPFSAMFASRHDRRRVTVAGPRQKRSRRAR